MRLKTIRENKGLTQESLANLAGVGSASVRRAERSIAITRIVAIKICNALGVTPEQVEGLVIKE